MFISVLKDEMNSFIELLQVWASVSYYLHSRGILEAFDKFLYEKHVEAKEIPLTITEEWISSLEGASRTIIDKSILVRNFYRYLGANGIYVQEPAIPIEKSDYIAYLFSDEEIEQILKVADSLHDYYISRKKNSLLYWEFPIMLRIFTYCGTRLTETVQLRIRDIDFENDLIYLTHDTKNGKQRIVPIHPLLKEQIQQYCLLVGNLDNGDNFLFPSSFISFDRPVVGKSISDAFREILIRLNIRTDEKSHSRGPCIHCLRHYFAFKSFKQYEESGYSTHALVPFLSVYLGHKSLDESSKYLRFHTTEYPEMYEKFDVYSNDIFPELDDEE